MYTCIDNEFSKVFYPIYYSNKTIFCIHVNRNTVDNFVYFLLEDRIPLTLNQYSIVLQCFGLIDVLHMKYCQLITRGIKNVTKLTNYFLHSISLLLLSKLLLHFFWIIMFSFICKCKIGFRVA